MQILRSENGNTRSQISYLLTDMRIIPHGFSGSLTVIQRFSMYISEMVPQACLKVAATILAHVCILREGLIKKMLDLSIHHLTAASQTDRGMDK